MAKSARSERTQAVNELKRSLIVAAAQRVFEAQGLEATGMRAIAKEAGYTAGAIYFHFDSKEAIYAEILRELLTRLIAKVDDALSGATSATGRFRAASMAFFEFFADHPRDLNFGFYLFNGGMQPAGLSRELDVELNRLLTKSLEPIGISAVELGSDEAQARKLMADTFAHAVGLLVLKHTHRIKMFKSQPEVLMAEFVDTNLRVISRKR